MAKLFPLRSEPTVGKRDPRVIELEDEDADAVFSALSSETARQLFAHLQEEPSTPSDLAAVVDSSIQNVRYHLEKMEAAGLVDVVDTWYSSRGNEMSVYAAADGPLIVTGDRSAADRIKGAVSRLMGAIAVLAGMSIALQYGLVNWLAPESETSSPDPEQREVNTESSDDFGVQSTAEDSASSPEANTSMDTTDGAAETAEAIFELLPPGILFFLGGLTILLLASGYWYWSSY